jgi:hypothetical protein
MLIKKMTLVKQKLEGLFKKRVRTTKKDETLNKIKVLLAKYLGYDETEDGPDDNK